MNMLPQELRQADSFAQNHHQNRWQGCQRRVHMEKYFGALTLALLLAMVLIRVRLLRRKGIQAIHFGNIDKTDFLIPPFALFYFYIVFAAAFGWPTSPGTASLSRGWRLGRGCSAASWD